MICRSRYIRTQKSQTCQSNINKQIISSSNLINKPNNYKMMFHVSNQQFYNKTSKNQLLQEKSTKSYCFPAGTCCCRFRRPRPRRCHLLRLRRFGQFVFGGRFVPWRRKQRARARPCSTSQTRRIHRLLRKYHIFPKNQILHVGFEI